MKKVPGKLDFSQPSHGVTGSSSAKNPSKVSYAQPKREAGAVSAKKNPTNVPFTQKTAPFTPKSSAKNAASAPFAQPKKGGSAPMPKETAVAETANPAAKKAKGQPNVAPKAKMKSISDVLNYRKKRYGM